MAGLKSQVEITQQEAEARLRAVQLPERTWSLSYHVLSVGQQARADLAATLDSCHVYDEFTSFLDRESAMALCRYK